jgi:hypothetical protein
MQSSNPKPHLIVTHIPNRENILHSSKKLTGEELEFNGTILQLLQGNFKKACDSIGE